MRTKSKDLLDHQVATGYSNGMVGMYSNEDGALYLEAVRTTSSFGRDSWIRNSRQSLSKQFPDQRTVDFTIGGVRHRCANANAAGDPRSSWCMWNDADTVGAVVGVGGIDAARLAQLAAEARVAIKRRAVPDRPAVPERKAPA